MDHCAQPGLLPLADALARMKEMLAPTTETESVTLSEALDRVLALSLHSAINVPAYDNSAMDGYTLRFADAVPDKPLTVIGQSLAGHAYSGEIGYGQCVRIMTGATLPKGADCVIMQEQTQLHDTQLSLNKIPKQYENVRRAGEDITEGTLVFPLGHRITPVDIGLLASLGIAELTVYRCLKVAVFSTGDELTPPGQTLACGHIYDSNRYALLALLQRLAINTVDVGLIKDEPKAISEAFTRAMNEADVVITTGGVSVGDADYTKDVLEQLGKIDFWKVAIKPGKPFAFGTLGKSWFFGLPGNPVSTVITYHQLVVPSLRYLAGEVFEPTPGFSVTAASSFNKQPGRADFQRGKLHNENGNNQVSSTGAQGSGILSSLAQANCYVVLEQERGSVNAGESVQVVPFDKFLL